MMKLKTLVFFLCIIPVVCISQENVYHRLTEEIRNNNLEAIKTIFENNKIDVSKIPSDTAVAHSNIETMAFLLEKGFKINGFKPTQGTPLMIAAKVGNTEVVDLLLKNGAQRNSKYLGEYSPFSYAVIEGHISTIDVFIKNNWPINDVNKYSETVLDLRKLKLAMDTISVTTDSVYQYLVSNGFVGYWNIIDAVKSGDTESVNKYLASGYPLFYKQNLRSYAYDVYKKGNIGYLWDLMAYAVYNGQIKMADYLLTKGYKKDSMVNYIEIAEKYKQGEMLDYLSKLLGIERSAEERFNDAIKTNSLVSMKSALNLCANEEKKKALINENFINAVRKCNIEIVELLIDEGAKPVGVYDACDLRKFELILLLINKGADVNETREHGRSAFHLLITRFIFYTQYGKAKKNPYLVEKYQQTIQFMIENGVDVNDQNSPWKETPLMHSLSAWDDTRNFLLDILIKNKADLNKKSASGLTAVMIATKNPKTALSRPDFASLKKLVEAGADYKTIKNKQGENAIEFAKRMRKEVPKSQQKKVDEIYKYLKALKL